MNVYWDENKLRSEGAIPSILGIGDSWFWYLLPGGSLINYLGVIAAKKQHVILAKGMNGAEAWQYAHGVYEGEVKQALKLYGDALSAVFISGGGNDFAGFNDLRPLLKANCSAEVSPRDCFRGGESGLRTFLERVDESYRTLIGRIYTRTSENCVVLMHCYDYAIPSGQSVIGKGGWLKPALDDAQVPTALQAPCIVYLIDAFYRLLCKIAKTDPTHLIVVDSRGTLAPKEWANELHPTANGFQKIANERWRPVMAACNLA
ncbi:MAG: SGNH/GDSL hydrolase family protein [Burkholderiales bacterium]|nr:SGNH/GDSL hydrolase family protein [Burkholderiales bacterium]